MSNLERNESYPPRPRTQHLLGFAPSNCSTFSFTRATYNVGGMGGLNFTLLLLYHT